MLKYINYFTCSGFTDGRPETTLTRLEIDDENLEFFEIYTAMNSAFRKRMQRAGLCSCPKQFNLHCSTDCEYCRYRQDGYGISLDAGIEDEDGDERPYVETFAADGHAPDEVLENQEFEAAVKAAVDSLPVKQRQVILLQNAGLDQKQIAERLGISASAVCQRISSAREGIKNYLKKFGFEP